MRHEMRTIASGKPQVTKSHRTIVAQLPRGPLLASKITTDPHILPHVNIECPDDRYPKLKIYIS